MNDRKTILYLSDAQVEALRPKWIQFKLMLRTAEPRSQWLSAMTAWLTGVLDALDIEDSGARADAQRRIRGAATLNPFLPKGEA